MTIRQVVQPKNLVLIAIVLVAALLVWSWLKNRKRVLDPSNDPGLAGVFAAMNPGLA